MSWRLRATSIGSRHTREHWRWKRHVPGIQLDMYPMSSTAINRHTASQPLARRNTIQFRTSSLQIQAAQGMTRTIISVRIRTECTDHVSLWSARRQLHAERPSLPDVPAVYFCAPTQANIRRIAADLAKSMYASTYVNFTSALSRTLLEEFAETVARDGTVEGVEQVRHPRSHVSATLSLIIFRA